MSRYKVSKQFIFKIRKNTIAMITIEVFLKNIIALRL